MRQDDVVAALFIVAVLAHASRAVAQGEWPEDAATQRALTVLVRSEFRDATPEEGTGFIVGASDTHVWIVTAKHVVAKIVGFGMPANVATTVTIRDHVGNSVDTSTPDVSIAENVDLAIVRFSITNLALPRRPWSILGDPNSIRVTDSVRIMGRRGSSAGRGSGVETFAEWTADGQFRFTVQPSASYAGLSGGPVFDEAWRLVGITTGQAGSAVLAYPISNVLFVARGLGAQLSIIAASRRCLVRVNSTPSGADVVDSESGEALGQTPLRTELEDGHARTVVVRAVGMRESQLTLSCSAPAVAAQLVPEERPVRTVNLVLPQEQRFPVNFCAGEVQVRFGTADRTTWSPWGRFIGLYAQVSGAPTGPTVRYEVQGMVHCNAPGVAYGQYYIGGDGTVRTHGDEGLRVFIEAGPALGRLTAVIRP